MRTHRGRAAAAAVLIAAASSLALSGTPSAVANHLTYVEPTEYEAAHPEPADPGVEAEAEAESSEEEYTAGYADSGLAEAMAAIRWCESSGDYGANTGNGYYGAYQFSLTTWEWIGYRGYPHEASPAVQDGAAIALYNIYGWSPWPSCAAMLGLL